MKRRQFLKAALVAPVLLQQETRSIAGSLSEEPPLTLEEYSQRYIKPVMSSMLSQGDVFTIEGYLNPETGDLQQFKVTGEYSHGLRICRDQG